MPRTYDDRAMRGKVKDGIRTALDADTAAELADRLRAIEEVKAEFDGYLSALYDAGTSQAALGRALGWTQQRVGIRIQRHREKVLRGLRPSVLR